METFEIENVTYTIPRYLVKSWFCTENYTAEEIYTVFNITCDHLSKSVAVSSDSKSSNNRQHVQTIATIAAIIFTIGFICNFALLAVLYTKKRFFKPSWYYVCNLVVADILVLINMLGFIFFLINPPKNWSNKLKSYLFPSLDIFLSSASMLSVTAIAIDRMLTVCSWQICYLKRRSLMVKYILTGLWSYCLFILTLSFCRIAIPSSKTYNSFVFWMATIVAFVGSVTITLICYVVLSYMYLKHTLLHKNSNQEVIKVDNLLKENNQCNEEFNVKQRHICKAITISFSALPFVLGWSFYLGIQTYEVITKTFLSDPALNIAMLFVPWIVSAINPVIYICTNQSIRKALLEMLCKCFLRRSVLMKQKMLTSTTIDMV